MSQWITDRLPTKADAIEGRVWFWSEMDNKPSLRDFSLFRKGDPWMPLIVPEPYVKPKRFTVKWLQDSQCWAVMDSHHIALRLGKLDHEIDEHREAAERVAAIYEEVLP